MRAGNGDYIGVISETVGEARVAEMLRKAAEAWVKKQIHFRPAPFPGAKEWRDVPVEEE